MTSQISGGARPWQDGRVVTTALTAMALLIYALGFRSAGFPPFDALGAASAHVIPGALVGVAIWRLQPWAFGKASFGWIIHPLLAIVAGLIWIVLMMAVTYAARPGIAADVLRRAAPSTFVSGIAVYATIAFVHGLLSQRRRVADSEAALANAKLTALRARVEPHFLFNTLETISAVAERDPVAAQCAIGRLGRMLRRTLEREDENDELASLSEELSLVRDYLEIEKLRLGDRLNVIERISENAGDLGIPPFCLQTLVENAVIHGISGKPDGGTVSVAASREGDRLVLVVADDGLGGQEAGILRGGLGIGLLRRRLDIHFAGRETFDVAAAPGHGVSVRISVPALEVG